MRLIMAVSHDGYVAKGPGDDMTWTGGADKRAFRLLTSVGGVCAAGARTFDLMPRLEGRTVHRLTRFAQEGSMTLGRLEYLHHDAWLLGGPTVAQEALSLGLIREAFFCVVQGVDLELADGVDEDGLAPEQLRPQMAKRFWDRQVVYDHGGLLIERWSRG